MPGDLASKMPKLNENRNIDEENIIYCHIFGIVGDWYLSEISEDKQTAFGYRHIDSEDAWEMEKVIPNISEWGEISLKELQDFVNNRFLIDKDIRFLIARDLNWEPTKFSNIDISKGSLFYPGFTKRESSQ